MAIQRGTGISMHGVTIPSLCFQRTRFGKRGVGGRARALRFLAERRADPDDESN